MKENKLATQTVYTPIDVKEKLPEKFGMQICIVEIIEDGLNYRPVAYQQFDTNKKDWTNPSICYQSCVVTHWFEKKDNQIVISIDEFRSIVAEAQGFSYDVGLDNCSVAESKKLSDTYINNLLAEKV